MEIPGTVKHGYSWRLVDPADEEKRHARVLYAAYHIGDVAQYATGVLETKHIPISFQGGSTGEFSLARHNSRQGIRASQTAASVMALRLRPLHHHIRPQLLLPAVSVEAPS